MSILAQNNAAAALKAVAEVTAAQVTEELSAGGKASAEQMQALNAGAAQADAAAKAAVQVLAGERTALVAGSELLLDQRLDENGLARRRSPAKKRFWS